MKKILLSGFITAMILSISAQTQVGRTLYDLQSNNSNCRRVAINPAGSVVATYTRSYQNSTTFDDRGTGYNYSSDNGTTWSEPSFPDVPSYTRPDTGRTGWPNVVFTNSKEVVISHFAANPGAPTYEKGLQVLRRDIGSSNAWEKIILNSNNSTNPTNNAYADEATWARAASRGDSIFVITGLATGTDMPGMVGGMQMYRSIDAGATWEGPNDIPLMNSTNFVANGGDNYSVDMNKNGKIAIVLGTYQVEVLTSTDWGATFTKQTVVAVYDMDGNPAPLFDGLSGETMDTVNASDRCYSVIVDDNDMVHVWFGRTLSFKEEATTTGTSYLPLSVGLVYWNDAMTEGKVLNETRLAAQQAALPNPYFSAQVFSNSGFGSQLDLYRASLTSMPSATYDDNGNIYVAYSAIVPAIFNDINDLTSVNNVNYENLHFREIYLLKSSDNGVTWDGPINVSNQGTKESVFPSVPRKIYGTEIPVLWQEDSIPGVNLQIATGVTHPVVENKIMYHNVSVASIVTPTDITSPTIAELEDGVNVVEGFTGCDINFSSIYENDDVPTGPNVLDYQIVPGVNYNVPGTHTLQVYVLDAAGNSSDTLETIVTIIEDVTPPVVTLMGPSSVDMLNGTSYTDPGIVITDNACDPSAAPVVTTDLDENVDGTYTYTYTVTDNSGLSTTVSRTINVIGNDVTDPVITSLGPITETIEACSSYTLLGVTAFDNIDYDITANVTSVGSVNEFVPGVYTVTYSVSDAAGNIGELVKTITVVDNTAPTITINNVSPSLLCVGGTFVGDAVADDCVDANIIVTNDAATVVKNDIPGTYTVTFSAEDNSGNIETKTLNVQVGTAPTPDFNITSAPGAQVVQVTDASTGNPTSWVWNWNDPNNANNSFSQNAIHPYQTAGSYEIVLTVSNVFVTACAANPESLKTSKTVEVSVGIAELNKLNAAVSIFPNPSNGIINVSIDEADLTDVKVSVYNLVGELVTSKTISNTSNQANTTFDLGNDAAGIYFVTISTENATISKKVIVK